ncbi:hypothetical protein PSHT_09632 [Puccinia striiformis]|uniref:Uncharacterized protein n=2 Tax=Puccinia striiformis TaxID=27350 RepID=A0A0L0W5Q0_9BASI|nr:hypothetical protein PSTG_00127 [Puccinia striiformis f. sp. tritici PST-78]POW08275.1 hypothetical protein PSHT_09632 [Puccinia striiformis]
MPYVDWIPIGVTRHRILKFHNRRPGNHAPASFQNSPTFFGFQSLFYLGHLSSLSQAAQKSRIQQRREAKFAEALKTGGASKKIGSNEIKAPKSKLPLTLIYGFLALFLGGLIFEFLRLII